MILEIVCDAYTELRKNSALNLFELLYLHHNFKDCIHSLSFISHMIYQGVSYLLSVSVSVSV